MGIKITPSVNAIPVCIDNGDIKYRIGSTDYTFHVESLEGYNVDKQCNMFVEDNIMIYVITPRESIILRYNGTGCVFTNKERVLVKNFRFEYTLPEINGEFNHGCVVTCEGLDFHKSIIRLAKVGDDYILSAKDRLSATFNKDEEVQYLTDFENKFTDVFPVMRVLNGKLEAHNVKTRLARYALSCEINYATGVILL